MGQAEKKQTLLIGISFLWAALILAIGVWWLYLITHFGAQLDKNMARMVKWEGGTFFVLLTALSSSLFFLYLRDQKKTKGLQTFFATMTHELKTPLASVRLQVEVLKDLLKKKPDPMVQDLAQRLIEDTQKLETQMDKILQLSSIERGGELNPVEIELGDFLNRTHSYWGHALELKTNGLEKVKRIYAYEFALELIFRNLFENSRIHAKARELQITISEDPSLIYIDYLDGGSFSGDPTKLGDLFYKYNSSKGSGIGLYLIEKLCRKMNAKFSICHSPLSFKLSFSKVKEENKV